MVDELPSNGEFFCVECDRFFVNDFTLKEHKRSKQHKQRVKELKVPPYSHEESERAAGMGSYIKPVSTVTDSKMDLDLESTTKSSNVKNNIKNAEIANSVNEFDDLLADSFATYFKLSTSIGSLVQQQANLVNNAVQAQRQFLELASRSQKPNDASLPNLLKPTSDLIIKIQALRDENRRSEFFNHLSAIAEGIGALGWVTIAPTPGPYVKEMLDSSQFYTNKVLVAFKDKDAKHVDWAKSWIQFLSNLQIYVRKNHTTGLVWNAKGDVISGSAGGVLPPPPPPPAGFFDETASNNTAKSSAPDTHAALFASINQGTDITRSLKKVNTDQMTHKNPSLRQSSVVPDKQNVSNGSSGLKKAPSNLPPKMELEGKKWVVENQHGNSTLTIDDTNMSQSVNVYNCTNSMLVVKGKVNSITVNRCRKFSIVFDQIVSVVEFIDSQRVQAQANGIVPTITMDKVDGIEVFLSKESLSCEIVSSKSSEINLSVPSASGDYVEHPIPEQLKSIWNGKSFQTNAIDKN
ncbi:F-actin-capping protein subunit alpha [Blomia tropicalis]|nr:F-actin-capping protein subunit alpha [Blomia tropicalis]